MKSILKTISYVFLGAFCLTSFSAFAEENFEVWKKNFEKEALKAGIKKETLDKYLPEMQLLPRVIEQDIKKPEFLQNFWDYINLRLTEEKIKKGREMMHHYETWLKNVSDEYGVPPEYLVAIWGMETNYGGYLGKTKLLNSLGSLAYHPRRRKYFTGELIAYFKILETEPYPPVWGSWDGGFGNFQFMPTTFVAYAVDADGNGSKSLIGSIPDSFASAANFLRSMGWHRGEIWGRQVVISDDFDWVKLHAKKQTVEEWVKNGIRFVGMDAFPEAERNLMARLIAPQGHEGPFFLAYPNFEFLRRWNGLELYGLTTGLLADTLIDRSPVPKRPEDFVPIKTETIIKMQEILAKEGYYKGFPDGKLGPKTRSALRDFQRENNLKQDGYPNKDTLLKLNTY